MPKAEISSRVKQGSRSQELLQKLFSEGVFVEESSLVRLPGHQIKLTKDQESKIENYLRQVSQNPYSPSPDITLEPDLIYLLIDSGKIVKTTAGVVFASSAYDQMVAVIMGQIKKNGKISLGETRTLFQTSRKYAQALLEYLDEKKLTKRVGDDRIAGPAAG
jgi:selenocysteine-specific elongation factor